MKYLYITSAIIFLISFYACENVIDIDLNSSNPALVADAFIEPNKAASLSLNYTADYFGTDEPKYEGNAEVVITSSNGNSEALQHRGNGIYTGNLLKGQVGQNYELSIKLGDEEYLGSTELLTPTSILELDFVEASGPGSTRGDDAYNLIILFTNNVDEENYYLLKYFMNDEIVEHQFTALPAEFIGNTEVVQYDPLFPVYEKGDKVRVEIFSIDEGTYTYYSQLQEITRGRGGSSTPYNPQSNMGNDILGYFRAWSMDSKTITINP